MKIVADRYIPFVEYYFGNFGELVLKPGRHIVRDDLLTADLLVVRSITQVTPALLHDTPVQWVGSVTTGNDHLDIAWLEQQGIGWSTVAGFNARPVVEYGVAVIAALQRRGMLTGKKHTAAVVGVGRIGQQVADILKMLGFEVMLCDPIRAAREPNFTSVTLHECAEADFITLHTPLTRTGPYPTFHCIERTFLQRLKPQTVLLNTSRGAVIDFAALRKYGQHFHICLDVWEHEPQIDKTILRMSNLATPHIAGYAVQGRYRGIAMLYEAARQAGVIAGETILPLQPPMQKRTFSGARLTWQEVVLTLCDPWAMTQTMKAVVMAEDTGEAFDHLRHECKNRYEFAGVNLADVKLAEHDRSVLAALGFNV